MKLVGQIITSMMEIATLDDIHSWAASSVRGLRGLSVHPYCRQNPPRPPEPLILYEFESCPFCRKVREVLTEVDLEYICRPCPRGSTRNRNDLKARGGRAQFPYLVDPNTETELYESEDIITYLVDTYGPGRKALGRLLSPLNTTGALAATAIRPKGGRVRPGLEDRKNPDELLILYNLEISPFCRKVREKLNELNLDYHVKNVGKHSARRPELVDRGGKMMIPYLVDPNTNVEMYESDDIIDYLEAAYGSP